VGEVVTLVRPDVADVSSGVESLPGIKDHEKIARFLEAVLGRSSTVG
jgi:phosphoribosylanthranilate isomerase